MTEPTGDVAGDPPRPRGPEPVRDLGGGTRFRTVTGELRRGEFTVGAEGRRTGVLAVRSVVVDGRPLTQKWVPRALGADNPTAYDLLDAEVRSLSRIAQVYAARHPAALPRLRGYNVDVDEPFLLVEQYTSPQLSQVLHHLEPQAERIKFVDGLLTSLWLCKKAGVTHRSITVHNLHWDGETVLLTDFEHALLKSRAGAAADVMAAGTVIRQVYLGLQPAHNSGVDPPHLRQELHGVFDPNWSARPDLKELMERYRVDTPQVILTDPAAVFAAGKTDFERVSRVKRGVPPASGPVPTPPTDPNVPVNPGGGAPPLRLSAGWIAVAAATLVLLIVLAVFVLPIILGGAA